MGSQGRERGLRSVLHRRLDHSVQTAEHAVHGQLRTSRDRRHESAHHGQCGATGLSDRPQTVVQPSIQAVQQRLPEGGGALLRRGGALEGKRRAASGRTTGVQLLEQTQESKRAAFY